MAESKKNSIMVACSIIGCIVTLITCGALIGNVQANVGSVTDSVTVIRAEIEYLEQQQTEVKQKQAFLEGQVSAKLDAITSSVIKIEKQVDDLIRAD